MGNYQIVAVAGERAAPIQRQSDDPATVRAIAWECYTYDQATGNPEANDYQVRWGAQIVYSAERHGCPAQVLCGRCHTQLVTVSSRRQDKVWRCGG